LILIFAKKCGLEDISVLENVEVKGIKSMSKKFNAVKYVLVSYWIKMLFCDKTMAVLPLTGCKRFTKIT
jgi:hypothetical protein